MPVLVLADDTCQALIAERRRTGGDRHDEVWDGVYVMNPQASTEHQRIVSGMHAILFQLVSATGRGDVFPGVNVTDRREAWTTNYRVPDLAVVLAGSSVQDLGGALLGGPEMIVEVTSPDERLPEKIAFYQRIGVRELLVIDSRTRDLTLYRLRDSRLHQVGQSHGRDAMELTCDSLPLTLRRRETAERVVVQVTTSDPPRQWEV